MKRTDIETILGALGYRLMSNGRIDGAWINARGHFVFVPQFDWVDGVLVIIILNSAVKG